jgi:hypothetical protein
MAFYTNFTASGIITAVLSPKALYVLPLLFVIVLLRATHWKNVNGEPTIISYSIPFIGHALKLAKDKHTFFRETL